MIHTKPVPNRFEKVTKSGIIAWEEGCLKCAVCVKKRCVYGVYDNRGIDTRQMVDSIDNQCMNCLRCVQSCPKELIHKSMSPEFKALGDDHWTPDIIARLWYQAETGKIPVSGAGYPGPFSGPGFDSMWTDMSEIVRPTRDGIHGREYISTAIDLGRTPRCLSFTESRTLADEIPLMIDIPLPIILRVPSFGAISEKTLAGWAKAAERLGSFLALPGHLISPDLKGFETRLVPVFDSAPADTIPRGDRPPLIEMPGTVYQDNSLPEPPLVIVRLPLTKGVEKEALRLVESGASIIHLEGSAAGRMLDDDLAFIKEGIQTVHGTLVEKGVRDEITLLASGGFAMAEHVAKAMICGVDGVFVDFPALIALECRMCRRCTRGLSCPVEIGEASSNWVASRVVNLIGAWHNQMLEVMGAMGIRDARRLRGESGRAMFYEELDRTTFESLGSVEEDCELE